MRKLCSWLLYDLLGWSLDITQEHPDKYMLCLAPHTSNWDFVIGRLYSRAENRDISYLMKKEWFFWPLGPIFRATGGIPVDRKKNCSMTKTMSELAMRSEKFHLCITPEGTRKPTRHWKRGFYYIAMEANLPILLYALDFKNRTIRNTKTFYPTGDYDKDIKEIKEYYRGIQGKRPENFLI